MTWGSSEPKKQKGSLEFSEGLRKGCVLSVVRRGKEHCYRGCTWVLVPEGVQRPLYQTSIINGTWNMGGP